MTNPFQQAPPAQAPAPQQPMISDTAAQQFAPQQAPAQQQFPGQVSAQEAQAFRAQQPSAFAQAAAPEIAQMQQPVQQAYAQQQAPNGYAPGGPVAPQGLPGQPWSPQQHEAYNQMRENGMTAQPPGYVPPVAPQAPVQQPQQFAPPAAPQGFPQAPFPGQQAPAQGGGFPGAPATAQGGGFDPAMFGAPSSGGGGTFPKVRDLENRLCLFRVKNRASAGTDYNDKTKTVNNYVANVAVLDGGPLYSSPSQDDLTGTPTLVSETVPYVIADMTIGQVGLQGRLKQDFVRGRVVRMPKGATEKGLMEAYPGMEAWQALFTWLQQDPGNVNKLVSGTFFWGIVPDDSEQANQLVGAFAQNPLSRELML